MNNAAIEIFKLKNHIKDEEVIIDEVSNCIYVFKGALTRKHNKKPIMDKELKSFLSDEIANFKNSKEIIATIFLEGTQEEPYIYIEFFDNENIDNVFGFSIVEYEDIEKEAKSLANSLFSLLNDLQVVYLYDAYLEDEIIENVERYVPNIEEVNKEVESKMKSLKGEC